MSTVEVPLLRLEGIWLYYQSCLQSLSMALNDLRRVMKGQQVHYVVDGYDFCNWLLDSSPASTGNPHHAVIQSNWRRFLRLCDGTRTCAVLSPFTILEFLETATKRLDITALQSVLTRDPGMQGILKALVDEENTFSDLPEEQSAALRALYGRVLDNKQSLVFFSAPGFFADLREHIGRKKVRLLDPMIPAAAQRDALFQCDPEVARSAVNYLRGRREKRRARFGSEKSKLYDALDVYHFIAIDNSHRLLAPDNASVVLVSSGILSRNSWYLLKYRQPPGTLTHAPDDWNVRAGDVPALLLSALQYNHDSNPATAEFLEDARSLARMIHWDLHRIPELDACLRNREERMRLHAKNPLLHIAGASVALMHRLAEDYLGHISDDSWKMPVQNTGVEEITGAEAREILDYLEQPARLAEMRTSAAARVGSEVRNLALIPPDWRRYVAPLGEDAFELLSSLPEAFGLDL